MWMLFQATNSMELMILMFTYNVIALIMTLKHATITALERVDGSLGPSVSCIS